jgi:hypothetical protein
MLTWLLAELDTPHVKATFGEPEFNLVAGVGPDFVIDREGKHICRVSGRNGRV